MKGVKAVALDVKSAADAVDQFQKLMMSRFKFMEDMQVNNVYKIKDKEVAYYDVMGKHCQFDEIFEVFIDADKEKLGRDYDKVMMQYPSGRIPKIMTIEQLYNGLKNNEFGHPELPEVKGYNPYITLSDIKKSKGIYKPKILLFLADELNELMNADDYKSVEIVRNSLGSIARLGRAAGCHLALACQRASSGTISTDLMNNIQQSILLGAFDSSASSTMFEKDISNLAKPSIKGRAFMQVGKKDMYEVQTYYTQPDKDWVFDETRRDTYVNPEWQKQKFGKRVENEEELDKLLKQNGFLSAAEKRLAMEEAERKMMASDEDLDEEEILDDEDEGLLGEAKPSKSLENFMNDDDGDDDFGKEDFSEEKLFAEIKKSNEQPLIEDESIEDEQELDEHLEDEGLSVEENSIEEQSNDEQVSESIESSTEEFNDFNDAEDLFSNNNPVQIESKPSTGNGLKLNIRSSKLVDVVSRDDGFDDAIYEDD